MEETKRQWDEWFAKRDAVSAEIESAVAEMLIGEDPFADGQPKFRSPDRVSDDMYAIGERYRANS